MYGSIGILCFVFVSRIEAIAKIIVQGFLWNEIVPNDDGNDSNQFHSKLVSKDGGPTKKENDAHRRWIFSSPSHSSTNVAYLSDHFNRLDLISIMSFWLFVFLSHSFEISLSHLSILRALSAIRIFRLFAFSSGSEVKFFIFKPAYAYLLIYIYLRISLYI